MENELHLKTGVVEEEVKEQCSSRETPPDMEDSVFDDIQLSLQGMTMLLNNDWQGAESIFGKYRYVSPSQMYTSL